MNFPISHLTVIEVPDRKGTRAWLVHDHARAKGFKRIVCFSCGNAATALREHQRPYNKVEILEVGSGPQADFAPREWWSQSRIARVLPDYFDATSGHLDAQLMEDIAAAYRSYQRSASIIPQYKSSGDYIVHCGSGETFVVLAMAFPKINLHAVYDNRKPHLTFNKEAPLNSLVQAIAKTVTIIDKDGIEHEC